MAPNALSVEGLRASARRRLPRLVFEFIDGGADDEITLRRNREALDAIAFNPRVAVDISKRTLATTMLGGPAAMPLAISPTGMSSVAWPNGDIALAEAAKAQGIPFTLSTQSSLTLEAVARVGGRLWFQTYPFRDRGLVASLAKRALDAGYDALVLTVDVTVAANREKDRRNGFDLPLKITPRLAFDVAAHPAWAFDVLRHGVPHSANVPGAVIFNRSGVDSTLAGTIIDSASNWDDLAYFRDVWPKALAIKGVMCAEDAARAVALGFDGVIVSNHGGRQLDGAPSTIEVLPEVVAAVGAKAEVLMDSGVRRGSDIAKALALGARGVMFGRPTLYGLATAGQPGAEHALKLVRAELHRTLSLIGCPNVADLGPANLRGN